MKLNFTWKAHAEKYATGESLYLNGIGVADYYWNRTRPKTDTDELTRWIGRSQLPGIIRDYYGPTPEHIKAELERAVTVWFEEATK